MTEKLFDKDSHIKEFTAQVLSCETENGSFKILLDKTAFFYEGGGQPSDKGTLDNANVLDVQSVDGEIYHYTDKPLAIGATVTGVLDWETRYDRMQNHSGEHIISGIVHSLYGLDNVGFHLSDETVTLDFDGILDEEQLSYVEKLANQVVWRNSAFKAYYPDENTLEKLDYRSKKELNGDIRIVEIEDCDICACCAPHVKSAGEIGMIKLLDTEKMRGGTRIFIKCGKRALEDYGKRYKSMLSLSSLMSVKQFEILDGAKKLYEQIASSKFENTTLKKRLINSLINTCSKEDNAVFEDGLDIKELGIFADGLYKKLGGIRAVFSKLSQDTYSFAICGDSEKLNIMFADFKTDFSVRGGGRNGMVQGTVEGTEEKLKLYFKN